MNAASSGAADLPPWMLGGGPSGHAAGVYNRLVFGRCRKSLGGRRPAKGRKARRKGRS